MPFLPDCGKVESNPGPDQGAAFHTFATGLADVFIPACDHLIMARAITSLHGTMTSAGLTVKDVASLLAIPGDSADDCLRLAAAYGLYANLSLTFPDGIPTWSSLSPPAPPKDSQIELLMQKIQDLELRLAVPQETPVDPLLPLSESAIKTFSLLPGRPRWMESFTKIFALHVTAMQDDDPDPAEVSRTIDALWQAMIQTQREYTKAYPSKTGPSAFAHGHQKAPFPTPWNPTARKLPLSLDEAIAQGGKMIFENWPAGPTYFLQLNDKKYYMANKSRILWDCSGPPPGRIVDVP